MRVELRVEGGFAGIRRPPLVLETGELEPGTAQEVEALVAALPASSPPAPTRGADRMRYEVVVVDGGARRGLVFIEPDVPEPVRQLLRLARSARRGQ